MDSNQTLSSFASSKTWNSNQSLKIAKLKLTLTNNSIVMALVFWFLVHFFFFFSDQISKDLERHHEGVLNEAADFMTTKSYKFDILPFDFGVTFVVQWWLICVHVRFISDFLYIFWVCQWKKIDFVDCFKRELEIERIKWLNFVFNQTKFAQLHWKSIARFLLLFIQSPK